MTLEELRKQAQACIDDIKREDYYVTRWEVCQHKKPLADCTREELLKPFQDFWELLPDSGNIRRTPFFAVCNLAEEYMMGDDTL